MNVFCRWYEWWYYRPQSYYASSSLLCRKSARRQLVWALVRPCVVMPRTGMSSVAESAYEPIMVWSGVRPPALVPCTKMPYRRSRTESRRRIGSSLEQAPGSCPGRVRHVPHGTESNMENKQFCRHASKTNSTSNSLPSFILRCLYGRGFRAHQWRGHADSLPSICAKIYIFGDV